MATLPSYTDRVVTAAALLHACFGAAEDEAGCFLVGEAHARLLDHVERRLGHRLPVEMRDLLLVMTASVVDAWETTGIIERVSGRGATGRFRWVCRPGPLAPEVVQ